MTGPAPRPAAEHGRAVLEAARLLRDLFETDVQDYPPLLADIEAAIAALHAPGHQPHYDFTGNLYALTLRPRTAEIANTRDRSVAAETLPLADFAAAFAVWRRENAGRA